MERGTLHLCVINTCLSPPLQILRLADRAKHNIVNAMAAKLQPDWANFHLPTVQAAHIRSTMIADLVRGWTKH